MRHETHETFAKDLNRAAIVLGLRGDFEGAIKACFAALTIDPDYSYAHYNLATAYYKKGMYLHAMRELYVYLELEPNCLDYEAVDRKITRLKNIMLKEEKSLLENVDSCVY